MKNYHSLEGTVGGIKYIYEVYTGRSVPSLSGAEKKVVEGRESAGRGVGGGEKDSVNSGMKKKGSMYTLKRISTT